MGFVLGMAQTGYPVDGDVVAQVKRMAAEACDRDVSLLVFPENLMCPRELTAQGVAAVAESLDGPFAQRVGAVARSNGLWILYTMYERASEGMPPFNTAVLVDDTGIVRGTYRKCHLYDAHGVYESERMSAGEELCAPMHTPFCTLGVGICYDLRFPEVSRALACAGCDVLVFPAAWHDGPQKLLHWQTLLRTRAIENECFVAGVCHAGPRNVGQSFAFDPLGRTLVQGADELLVCPIDVQDVRNARDAMPVLGHRRPKLYGGLLQ